MSNINYDIWGAPETWGQWSDSPTSNTIWGNIRIGANNYSNADFTDYPSFKLGGTNQTLRAKCNAGEISVNTPLDNSIAYTAIANPDLPQCNVGLFGKGHTTKTNPFAIRDNSAPIPFSFAYLNDLNYTYYNMSRYQQLLGFDGFPDNATVIGQQKLQRWSPYAYMNPVNTTVQYEYNQCGALMPVLSFGIKSVIFEIIIAYVDYNNIVGHDNLKSYLNHTESWLQNHKCVGAYLRPYYRVNVNGTYSTNIPSGVTVKDRANGINPIFFTPYKLNGIDILNYSGNWARNCGCLPIYGNCISDGSYQYTEIISTYQPNPDNDTCSEWAYIYGYDKGNLHVNVSDDSAIVYIELDLSVAENVEYIMRGAAAYGLFFCQAIGALGNSGRDSGVTERWLDNEMYCGVIADDGMTYGDYTQGAGNADNQVYGWKESTQTPFDPKNIPDTDNTKYDDETKYRQLGYFPTACNAYVCSGGAIEKLSDVIATSIRNRPDPDVTVSEYTLDSGLTNNPIDTIISIKMYPSTQVPAYGSDIPIMFGAWSNAAVTGKELAKNYGTADFTFSRSRQNGFVAAFGNSFLDYAPYTRAELIIPYCGTVQLSAADFLNHDINVRMVIDYMTGACTAFIQRDGIAVLTCSGSIGVDIPITGIQTATFDSQRLNAVLARENALNNSNTSAVGGLVSALGAVGSLMTGNVLGAVASVGGLMSSVNNMNQTGNAYQKADYDLKHLQVPVKAVQSASPLISYVYENVCRLIIYRPVLSSDYDPAVYADTVGFACLRNGKVKQYSGLTVGNINTDGIAAPEPVKAMIQKLFAAGVYL